MYRRRHPLLIVATFIFVISTLPVKADHCEHITNNLEAKHDLKVSMDNIKPCTHKQSIQEMLPNLSMIQPAMGVGKPTFSTEPPLVSQ